MRALKKIDKRTGLVDIPKPILEKNSSVIEIEYSAICRTDK